MPTTPPPPTARTHEEQRTSTLLSFYSLLCTSLLPSTFNLHFIIKNAVRVGSGGRMGGQILSFSSLSPRRELAISSPLRLLSPTPRSCPLVLFLVGFFFCLLSCYTKDKFVSLLHASTCLWGKRGPVGVRGRG